MATADYIPEESFEILLKALMPENRLALQVSLATGLRIDDVLHIKSKDIVKERFTVKEMKTGKRKRIRIPKVLREECIRYSGRYYVFEHRLDPTKPRTRQAVYKDLKRACDLFRVNGLQISPHTARKIYSVCLYDKYNSVDKVKQALNHAKTSTTEIYCNADVKTEKATRRKKVKIPK
jgi:integrase